LVTDVAETTAQPEVSADQRQDTAQSPRISGLNVANPPDLPVIGKWMLGRDGSPADWLGVFLDGKRLREPINVIIVDEDASSAEAAKARLLSAAAAAGYPIRMRHSTGYHGYLGGQLYAQMPVGWDDAFSNEPFEVSNNHGRIFGPHRTASGYVFVGAFSREEVVPFRWPAHRYASFNQAREDFARRLDQSSPYKLIGLIDLENAIQDDPQATTGDHDGRAVLVRALESDVPH
jgi:hypothetical protein